MEATEHGRTAPRGQPGDVVRRTVLGAPLRLLAAGGVALLGGAGLGTALGFTGRQRTAGPRAVPTGPATPADTTPAGTTPAGRVEPLLLGALQAERALLADLVASASRPLSGTAASPRLIAVLQRDHTMHLTALLELADRPTRNRSNTLTPPVARVLGGAALAVAESAAADAAARRAASATGPVAAILASIAACEAGHAALLRT